jgi:hypothetical protein
MAFGQRIGASASAATAKRAGHETTELRIAVSHRVHDLRCARLPSIGQQRQRVGDREPRELGAMASLEPGVERRTRSASVLGDTVVDADAVASELGLSDVETPVARTCWRSTGRDAGTPYSCRPIDEMFDDAAPAVPAHVGDRGEHRVKRTPKCGAMASSKSDTFMWSTGPTMIHAGIVDEDVERP